MTPDIHADTERLFDELIDLSTTARTARLLALALDPLSEREVTSLLASAERAGDFLGLLRDRRPSVDAQGDADALVAGRYRLDRLLGSGAVGDVYLARDLQLERSVALKFLRVARGGADEAIAARFRAEARAAARLDHPNVVTVYDTGDTGNAAPFIVMAYHPGETLRERMERAPLPPAVALRIAAQVAGALAAAHAAGIVHRDVKPANVLLDAEGVARLTDFGIAKLLTDPDVTGRGTALGTPAYMSPEQSRGEAVDVSTDLWALGVMLHEMLTGARPFGMTGERVQAAAEINPAARALIATLLSEDRARRSIRASEVAEALNALLVSHDMATRQRAPAPGHGALPLAVTSLIGRERQLEEARLLLGKTRLLTLTGPGGTGKTRLALELASSVRDAYADGVWFVPLGEISDAALVPSSIAHALGVRDLGTAPLGHRVIGAIGARQLLLVLDNFEHVLAAAPFAATLLAACSGITLLATSRSPLDVQGEQVFPVPPLVTPLHLAPDAAESAAVRLFVSRARAARPSFTLDDESLSAVVEICRRLDGLPLALELAAARAKLLSPRAILSRLEQRFDLLRADGPDRPARHGTMRAVIDWSYILLSDEERALFGRLAVFAGGASLEATEAVAIELRSDSASQVLDLVASLSSKSLIHSEEQLDGEPRLLMLETIREYGLERLAGGADDARARHAHRAYFGALAERAAAQLRGPAQAWWLDQLEREYANFRVSLESALMEPAEGLRDAARLAVALHRLWLTRGPLFEGIEYISRILAVAEAAGEPSLDAALLAHVLSSAAHLVGARSLFPQARDLFARSLALYREAGDRASTAVALNNLAWQMWMVGDLAGGEAMSLEAMAIHQECADDLGVALSRSNLGWIALERGHFDDGKRHFDAAIESHQRRGDPRAVAFALSCLGELEARRGAYVRAVELQERALEVGDLVADVVYRTVALVRLAAARHALGDAADQAAIIASTYLPTLRELGRLWPLGYTLTVLGTLLLEQGETARACAAMEEALEARRAAGTLGGVTETLLMLGIARARAGDRSIAAALLTEALASAREYGAPPLITRCINAIAQLDATRDTVDD